MTNTWGTSENPRQESEALRAFKGLRGKLNEQAEIIEQLKDPEADISKFVAEHVNLPEEFNNNLKSYLLLPGTREKLYRRATEEFSGSNYVYTKRLEDIARAHFPEIVMNAEDIESVSKITRDMLYRAPKQEVQQVLMAADKELAVQWAGYHAALQGKHDGVQRYNELREEYINGTEKQKLAWLFVDMAISATGGIEESPLVQSLASKPVDPEKAKEEFDTYLDNKFKKDPRIPGALAGIIYAKGLGKGDRIEYAEQLAQTLKK